MLEFQEGYYDQEVREGFYVDTTMKTVWAAEMEVLQRVAEICDKYGMKWYAAYGSLLGAIRHEGFVPWDDDMDIWMLREDYNKMMKILPKELPEGYLVRGPLTDEGYDQFHTCINSGSGICITDEWLETYHGCPFTVGLDIFPLDYLPRDEKEREFQKALFILTGRVAQLAKNISHGDYDKEDSERTVDEVIEEIKEGIDYLESNYKFNINRQLLEEKEWDKLASEMWKFGNYVAMMYKEEDADYIVEYLDYVRWEYKIFPKEWFAEVYGATYENFMLMIPCGYEPLLNIIYKDYLHYTMFLGYHEYPYYARQLRQLREYVKEVESAACQNKSIAIDEIEVVDDLEIPAEWKHYFEKEDGTQKVVILSANNPQYYVDHKEQALMKLENTLQFFKNNQKDVVLWWRPHPVMRKLLDMCDEKLGSKYQEILDQYKEDGWGICDETDNTERAVKNCGGYYGEMNAVIQELQIECKPIMLTEEAPEGNEKYDQARKDQFRAYINYTDACVVGNKEIFANTNYNALVIRDKDTKEILSMERFADNDRSDKNIHLLSILQDQKILFLPVGNGNAHIYNMVTSEQKTYEISKEEMPEETWRYHKCGKDIYLMAPSAKVGIWKWDYEMDTFEKQDWWKTNFGEEEIMYGSMDDETFYAYEKKTRKMCVTNVVKKEIKEYESMWGSFSLLAYDGSDFFFTVCGNAEMGKWNLENGLEKVYSFEADDWFYPDRDEMYYSVMECTENGVFLIPQLGNEVYYVDKESGEKECLYTADFQPRRYLTKERDVIVHRDEENIYVHFKTIDFGYVINAKSKSVSILAKKINLEAKWDWVSYWTMYDRKALLREMKDNCNLEFLIQYLKG